MFTTTTANIPNYVTITPCHKASGVYEYIIYILEDGEFELLDEGKIYASSEQAAKDKVLFDFAKSEEGSNWELEDLHIKVRLF